MGLENGMEEEYRWDKAAGASAFAPEALDVHYNMSYK